MDLVCHGKGLGGCFRQRCVQSCSFSRIKLLPFRSLLLQESHLHSFVLGTKMLQFVKLSLVRPWIQ